MREILFRGKRLDNGRWVEGYAYYNDQVSKIIYAIGVDKESHYCEAHDVFPTTVSEFTGLHDKNGKQIFEGDLLKITSTVFGGITEQQTQKREDIALVEYDSKTGGYRLKVYNNGKYKRISKFTKNHLWAYDAEVIGNKWDNPELLEG